MRLLIIILSGPFVALSRIAEMWNICGICKDIASCLNAVDSTKEQIPFPFLVSLIAAEDHRSALHKGVDPVAVVRAAYVRIRFSHVQGASTVEQQFVRVVTSRYDRTVRRKVREQILAIAISRRRSKLQIASAYLSIAFYGSGCVGIEGLLSRCGNNLYCAEQNDIRGMIARLKYPEPLQLSADWKIKIRRRIEYISYREAKSANNWLKPIAYVAGAPPASA